MSYLDCFGAEKYIDSLLVLLVLSKLGFETVLYFRYSRDYMFSNEIMFPWAFVRRNAK